MKRLVSMDGREERGREGREGRGSGEGREGHRGQRGREGQRGSREEAESSREGGEDGFVGAWRAEREEGGKHTPGEANDFQRSILPVLFQVQLSCLIRQHEEIAKGVVVDFQKRSLE
jgi:hypothetical protein